MQSYLDHVRSCVLMAVQFEMVLATSVAPLVRAGAPSGLNRIVWGWELDPSKERSVVISNV